MPPVKKLLQRWFGRRPCCKYVRIDWWVGANCHHVREPSAFDTRFGLAYEITADSYLGDQCVGVGRKIWTSLPAGPSMKPIGWLAHVRVWWWKRRLPPPLTQEQIVHAARRLPLLPEFIYHEASYPLSVEAYLARQLERAAKAAYTPPTKAQRMARRYTGPRMPIYLDDRRQQ